MSIEEDMHALDLEERAMFVRLAEEKEMTWEEMRVVVREAFRERYIQTVQRANSVAGNCVGESGPACL